MPTATVNPSLSAFSGPPPTPCLGGVPRGLGQGAHDRALAVGRRALLAAALGACLTAAVASARPAVSTDRTGYFPGDTVLVTGGGWLPHEAVTLTFFENPIQHEPRSFMAITDSSGSLRNDEYVIGVYGPGSGFTLIAHSEVSDLLATATITYHSRGASPAGHPAARARTSGRQERAAQPLPPSTSPGTASPAGNGPGSPATESTISQAGN